MADRRRWYLAEAVPSSLRLSFLFFFKTLVMWTNGKNHKYLCIWPSHYNKTYLRWMNSGYITHRHAPRPIPCCPTASVPHWLLRITPGAVQRRLANISVLQWQAYNANNPLINKSWTPNLYNGGIYYRPQREINKQKSSGMRQAIRSLQATAALGVCPVVRELIHRLWLDTTGQLRYTAERLIHD